MMVAFHHCPLGDGPSERGAVTIKTIGVQEKVQASLAIVKGPKSLGLRCPRSDQRNPDERGESEVPIRRGRPGGVPIDEAAQGVVLPHGVVRRGIMVTDDQSGRPLVTGDQTASAAGTNDRVVSWSHRSQRPVWTSAESK
jgi:hypothetical protein